MWLCTFNRCGYINQGKAASPLFSVADGKDVGDARNGSAEFFVRFLYNFRFSAARAELILDGPLRQVFSICHRSFILFNAVAVQFAVKRKRRSKLSFLNLSLSFVALQIGISALSFPFRCEAFLLLIFRLSDSFVGLSKWLRRPTDCDKNDGQTIAFSEVLCWITPCCGQTEHLQVLPRNDYAQFCLKSSWHANVEEIGSWR